MNNRTLLPAVLATIILPLSALADTETVDGIEWTYTVSDGEASVGSYYYRNGYRNYNKAIATSTSGAITIPATLGGYPVTRIGQYAFDGCLLRKIYLPIRFKGHVGGMGNLGPECTIIFYSGDMPPYSVSFAANGGKLPKGKKMPELTMTYGKKKNLTANKFKRTGYVFKGWAKSKALTNKGKVAYKNKASVKNLVTNGKTVKLYAVWKKK